MKVSFHLLNPYLENDMAKRECKTPGTYFYSKGENEGGGKSKFTFIITVPANNAFGLGRSQRLERVLHDAAEEEMARWYKRAVKPQKPIDPKVYSESTYLRVD